MGQRDGWLFVPSICHTIPRILPHQGIWRNSYNIDNEHLYLLVGCDSIAHHIAWGSTNCNGRGEALMEFLDSSNLEIINRGNEPTFCNISRQEVTDITLGSFGLLERIIG
jgi:hypothetical protein